MGSGLEIWLTVCAAVFVLAASLRWVVGPIRLHARHFAAPQLALTAATAADLSPEMRDFFSAFESQFARLGFTDATTWAIGESVWAATGVTAIMSSPTGDTARAIAARTAMTRANVLSIRSKFWDGSAVVTSNSAVISGYRANPRTDTATFPWVRDAATLVEAHARRLTRLGKADSRRIDAAAAGEETLHLQRNWAEELEWHVASGYMVLDAAVQRYRLTWRGAVMVSWKLTSPVKPLLLRWRERNARRLWKALRMDEWSPPTTVAEPVDEVASPSVADRGTTGDAAPTTLESSRIGYEIDLPEGELRQQQQGQSLVLRMGGPTSATAVRRQIPRLVFATFFATAFGVTVANAWLVWHQRYLPTSTRWHMMVGPNWLSAWWAVMWLVFLGFDVRQIVSGIRNARGTVVLTASPAGLAFDHAPDSRSSGEVRRDELEWLVLRVHKLSITGRRYRLDARLIDGSRVTLLVGKNRAVLAEARLAMLGALGMVVPSEVSQA